MNFSILQGDSLARLREMPDDSVNCIVTSPPYWGLRDYGVEGQIGLESTPQEYVARMVEVFAECRRVLAKDGTCWVNLGDSYSDSGRGDDAGSTLEGTRRSQAESRKVKVREICSSKLRPKNLIGVPWRVAFALQDDGWYLRSDVVWAKPNAMPESVQDRPTRAHEYIFLLAKSQRYWYDANAIRTEPSAASIRRWKQDIENQSGSLRANGGERSDRPMKSVGGPKKDKQRGHSRRHSGFNDRWDQMEREDQVKHGANARTVWNIAVKGYIGEHFAAFPEEIPRRCILAGCPEGGTVLDPFLGSGTTIAVAIALGRKGIGIELNPNYIKLAEKRISAVTPGFCFTEVA